MQTNRQQHNAEQSGEKEMVGVGADAVKIRCFIHLSTTVIFFSFFLHSLDFHILLFLLLVRMRRLHSQSLDSCNRQTHARRFEVHCRRTNGVCLGALGARSNEPWFSKAARICPLLAILADHRRTQLATYSSYERMRKNRLSTMKLTQNSTARNT